ncbi:MAG: hypothetical protein EBU88_16885 [Acidobacteria bacterium]|nr:hypothetical protein [Acidobacteriota bacterium]
MNDYQTIAQAIARLERDIQYYNSGRPHQSLDYQTPEAVQKMGSAVAIANVGNQWASPASGGACGAIDSLCSEGSGLVKKSWRSSCSFHSRRT